MCKRLVSESSNQRSDICGGPLSAWLPRQNDWAPWQNIMRPATSASDALGLFPPSPSPRTTTLTTPTTTSVPFIDDGRPPDQRLRFCSLFSSRYVVKGAYTGFGISHGSLSILRIAFHALDCGFFDFVEVSGDTDRFATMDVSNILLYPVADAPGAAVCVWRSGCPRRCDLVVEFGRWKGWKLDV